MMMMYPYVAGSPTCTSNQALLVHTWRLQYHQVFSRKFSANGGLCEPASCILLSCCPASCILHPAGLLHFRLSGCCSGVVRAKLILIPYVLELHLSFCQSNLPVDLVLYANWNS